MKPESTVVRRLFKSGGIPMLVGGALLALLAFACGPAEESTPTPAPTATAETAATATPQAESGAPTATAAPERVAPTATPAEEEPVASARPEVTAEIIDRLPQMTAKEFLTTFPAVFPKQWEFEDVKRGGTFRAAVTWDISMWDPRMTAAGGTMTVSNMVYERLVEYAQGIERKNSTDPAIIGDLAESWEYSEDGTALTFKLHEGVHWGDPDNPLDRMNQPGPEVVAEDLKYIYEQYRDDSVYSGLFKVLETVEVVDQYTFVMHFTSPAYYMLAFLASKDGVTFNPYLARAERIKKEIVGPGPWIVEEAKKSQEVRLKANPDYYMKDPIGRPLPYLDGVQLLIAPDSSTRVALLRTGRVEHAASAGRRPREIQTLLRTNPDLQIFTVPYTYAGPTVSMQLNNPLFQDVNVRRALELVTDQRGISNVIHTRLGVPTSGKYGWPYFTDAMPTWDSDLDAVYGPYTNHYDPEKARELWAQAGLSEMTFDLPFFAYNEEYEAKPAVVADMWRELGITVKPRSLDYSDYNSSLQRADYETLIYSWGYPDYSAVDVGLNKMHSQGAGNRENIDDPVIDELVDEASRTGDPAKIRELVNKIRARAHEQVYYIPMTAQAYSAGNFLQPYVRGIQYGKNSGLQYYYMGPQLRDAWLDK